MPFRKLMALFTRAEQYRMALLLLAMLVGAALEALAVGVILPLISLLNDPKIVREYPGVMQFLSQLGVHDTHQIILASCLGVLLFFIVKNVYLGLLLAFQFGLIYEKQAVLSRRLLSIYLTTPWTFHLQRNTAELLRNITHQISMLFVSVLNPLTLLVTEAMVILAIVAVLMIAVPLAASVAILILGGFAYMFYRFTRRQADALGKKQQHHMLGMMKWVNQALGGLKETKVYGREGFFLQAYGENVSGYVRSYKYIWTLNNLPRLFLETLIMGGLLLIAMTALWTQPEGGSLVPVVGLFGAAAFRLLPSFNRLVVAISNIRYHGSVVDVIHHDLCAGTASPLLQEKPAEDFALPLRFEKQIELRHVSFRYPTAARNALNRVSLTIPKGKSVAFIGASGAGKTTLVDVILGLLTPDSGEVLVDGRSIYENTRGWQNLIGYIPQDIYLCDDSIRRNVAFGIADAEIDDRKVWQALKDAQLRTLVEELPERLDTFVGERGMRLSGGQRQRIGIARALYHDPQVVVLDEATSSLDTHTEKEVMRAIEGLKRRKTLIIITHRISTTAGCDVKFELKDGRIANRHVMKENGVETALAPAL